MIFDVI